MRQELYIQQHQESLLTLSQNMGELCERFTYKSQITASSGDNELGVEEAFSSEIQHRFPFLPVAQLRSSIQVQLKEAVQATMTSSRGNKTQDENEQQVPSVNHSINVGDIVPYRCRRHLVAYPSQTIIRTPLGEVRCSVSNFRTIRALCTEVDEVSDTSGKNLDIETSFSFVPSWWLIKLGLGYGFKFDLNAMCSQGRQVNIRSYNVRGL
jgi:hypothetical protein